MREPTPRSAEAPDALAFVGAKREVIGNTVITEDGSAWARCMTGFRPDTFALTSLSVPPGMNVVGEILMIPGDKVLTIGKDVTLSLRTRRCGQV